jgi:membrane protein DedA with SNARE-associated domain
MKYIPPHFDSLEEYQKDLKLMATFCWCGFLVLLGTALGFAYFGWKIAPWVIAGFAFFQNLPLAIMYTIRFRWAIEKIDERVD